MIPQTPTSRLVELFILKTYIQNAMETCGVRTLSKAIRSKEKKCSKTAIGDTDDALSSIGTWHGHCSIMKP